MKTAAKIVIIITMIFTFWLIIPLIIGIMAISKIDNATDKSQITGIALCTLLFCSLVGGILMFCIPENDFKEPVTKIELSSQVSTSNSIEDLKNLKQLLDDGIISQEVYEEKRKKLLIKI